MLIGMPGAGKSTVGPALAQMLGWGFIDLDENLPGLGLTVNEQALGRFHVTE